MSEVKYDFERNKEELGKRTETEQKIQDAICEILKMIADKGYSVNETMSILLYARLNAGDYIDKHFKENREGTKFSETVMGAGCSNQTQ